MSHVEFHNKNDTWSLDVKETLCDSLSENPISLHNSVFEINTVEIDWAKNIRKLERPWVYMYIGQKPYLDECSSSW